MGTSVVYGKQASKFKFHLVSHSYGLVSHLSNYNLCVNKLLLTYF